METAIEGHMRGVVRYRSTKDQNRTSGWLCVGVHHLDCHVCDRSFSPGMAYGLEEMENRYDLSVPTM